MITEILMILTIVTIISSIAWSVYKYTSKSKTNIVNSIVLHDGVDFNDLQENIVTAYYINSYLDDTFNLIKLTTHNISHWMVALKTSSNHSKQSNYYIVSSSSYQYIEIFEAFPIISTATNAVNAASNANDAVINNENIEGFIYKQRNKNKKITVINNYNVNVKLNVINYAIGLRNYYKSMGNYSLFNNNCHKVTTYGLTELCGIDCLNDLQHNYKFTHLVKETLTSHKQ